MKPPQDPGAGCELVVINESIKSISVIDLQQDETITTTLTSLTQPHLVTSWVKSCRNSSDIGSFVEDSVQTSFGGEDDSGKAVDELIWFEIVPPKGDIVFLHLLQYLHPV